MATTQQESAVALTAGAKSALGDLIERVGSGERIVLEFEGEPQAALISIADYERYRAAAEQQRRNDVLERIRRLRAEVRARNQDMSEEEVEAFAQEVRDDVMQSILERRRRQIGQ